MQANKVTDRGKTVLRWLLIITDASVLVVSAALIVLISLDVLAPPLSGRSMRLYHAAQTPVCFVYLLDFFMHLATEKRKWHYFHSHILIFLISIPYSAIFSAVGLHTTGYAILVLHYMPVLRAVLAGAFIAGFVSGDKIVSLFASYLIVLLLTVYLAALIFYTFESGINPGVKSFWSAFWWCFLQATTLGGSFYATTLAGRIVAMVVSLMGVLMFPLFTVFLANKMKNIFGRKADSTQND